MIRLGRAALANWRERHRHPFNFVVHLPGIALALAGAFLLLLAPFGVLPAPFGWQWGLAGLIAGYLLQYLGHTVEGNDVGEWAAIKRLLGWPTVPIAPHGQPPPVDGDKNGARR